MNNALQEVRRLGQSIWYDNIRRGLIDSGELQRLIDVGVSGLTSNPTIFEKAIAGSTDYDDALLDLAREGKSADEIYEALAIEDIRAARRPAAFSLRTQRRCGWVRLLGGQPAPCARHRDHRC